MIAFVVALFLLLPLSAPFGEATATATSVDAGLRLEVSVEVAGAPVAVVARGVATGGSELPPVALSHHGGGRWGGIVELPVVENILLGFEIIPGRGQTTMSELHTLVELGVDRAIFELDRTPTGFGQDDDDPLVTPEGQRWGWLGLGAGAGALAFLSFWVIGSVRSRDDEEEPEPEDTSDLDDDAETLSDPSVD
jgi:hypothetical protein